MTLPPFSVGTRILGLGLSLLLLPVLAALILLRQVDDERRLQQRAAASFQRFEAIYAGEIALQEVRRTDRRRVAIQGPGTAEARQAFDQARAALARQIEALTRTGPLDGGQTEALQTARAALATLERRSSGHPDGDPPDTRLDPLEASLAAAGRAAYAVAWAARSEEARSLARVRGLGLITVGCAVVVAGVLGWLLLHWVIVPLRRTRDAVERIGRGQFDVELPGRPHDEFGAIVTAARSSRDQTVRLARLAYQDALTGLGNRTRFEEKLGEAIEARRGGAGHLAVFAVDLDHFRSINDRVGHQTGDRYLIEAATRLLRFIPSQAGLFRLAGDRFAILSARPPGEAVDRILLQAQAEVILRGLGEAYVLGDEVVSISASIGVAEYPGDGETATQLIHAVDAAVFAAKKHGRNTTCFAADQTIGTLRRQLAVAGDIQRGIERDEFEPFYQPIVDVERGRVIGAEALLRWRHPEQGWVPPVEFVRIAEESGLVAQLGELCLRRAHEQALGWNARGRRLKVAVNVSVRQVHDGRIIQILRSLGKPPAGGERPIEFELTESALLDSTEYTQQVLVEIKRLGFRIGLDDFGTGYSSLSYLQRLPIDKIKIDRQFVAAMGQSKQALAIVSATLTLAQNLDLAVVAEGVETAEQMRQLRILGCRLQQGFFFAPALPALELEGWIDRFERGGVEGLVEPAPQPPTSS